MNLPVIDFSNNTPKEKTRIEIRVALEEYGCLEAVFNEFPVHLRKSLLEGLEQFFDLPREMKLCSKSKDPYEGYVAGHAMGPLFESFGIDDVEAPANIDRFTALSWRHGNPTFSKIVESFSEQLWRLDRMVRKMIIESLGLEKYMDEHMNSTKYLFRAQRYDSDSERLKINIENDINEQEKKVALKSHTDKSFVTILCQNEVNGLQIQTRDGEWIAADQPAPNSLIVLIGDSFHAWTNGRLRSPPHRVIMVGGGDEARYSVGLFAIPKIGYKIKSPEEMVDEERPLLFKAFEYQHFQDFYFSPAGRASPDPLKDYCGI